MGGKNYLVSGCVDILWKIMGYLLGSPDITIFMDHMGLLMEEEKKLQQHYAEKFLMQEKNNESKIGSLGRWHANKIISIH